MEATIWGLGLFGFRAFGLGLLGGNTGIAYTAETTIRLRVANTERMDGTPNNLIVHIFFSIPDSLIAHHPKP